MDLSSLLFPLLILVLFIPLFLSGRKQRRQMADMQQLQRSLEPGDVVMTTSGLRATVVDSSYEDTVDLEIADGIVTTWVRAAVREKVPFDGATAGATAATADAPAELPADLTDPPVVERPVAERPVAERPATDTNGTAGPRP